MFILFGRILIFTIQMRRLSLILSDVGGFGDDGQTTSLVQTEIYWRNVQDSDMFMMSRG